MEHPCLLFSCRQSLSHFNSISSHPIFSRRMGGCVVSSTVSSHILTLFSSEHMCDDARVIPKCLMSPALILFCVSQGFVSAIFRQSVVSKIHRHSPQRNGMFAGARDLASDHISHCRSKIRSVTPEETVKETKKRKAKNLQTCSVIDSPFFSPRELISLKCNTNPLIKLSRETISVYNSKPVCSDSEQQLIKSHDTPHAQVLQAVTGKRRNVGPLVSSDVHAYHRA